MTNINGTLSPKLREAGYELEEDDHVVTLKHLNEIVARFSAARATSASIHKTAEEHLKNKKEVK